MNQVHPSNVARRFAPGGTTAQAQAGPAKRSLRDVVQKRTKRKARRVLIYGEGGVGKTTFACTAPKCALICPERGSDELLVDPFVPTCWRAKSRDEVGVIDLLQMLVDEDHDYQSIGLDSLDWIEQLIVEFVCFRDHDKMSTRKEKLVLWVDGKPNIAGYGYNEGWGVVQQEWTTLFALCDRLRDEKDMNVILVSHDGLLKQTNEAGADYGIRGPAINKLSAMYAFNWCDACLFAQNRKTVLDVGEMGAKGRKGKVVSDGSRILYTEQRGGFLAKNRYSLPFVMDVSYEAFDRIATLNDPLVADQIRTEIKATMARLSAARTEEWRRWLLSVGNDVVALRTGQGDIQALIAQSQAVLAEIEALVPQIRDPEKAASVQAWLPEADFDPAELAEVRERVRAMTL